MPQKRRKNGNRRWLSLGRLAGTFDVSSLGWLFSATLIKNAHSVAQVAYKDTGTLKYIHTYV